MVTLTKYTRCSFALATMSGSLSALQVNDAAVVAAAAQAHLHALVLVAGGVDGDALAQARLGGGVGPAHRRDHPHGGLRRRRPHEQQDEAERDQGEAGRRQAGRPGGEGASARRRRRVSGIRAGPLARWRAAATDPAIHVHSREVDCTHPIGREAARVENRACAPGRRTGRAPPGARPVRVFGSSGCRAAAQSLEKYLRTSQSVTCSRYSYHSLSLLVTKRSKTWSPSVRRTSSLSRVSLIAS